MSVFNGRKKFNWYVWAHSWLDRYYTRSFLQYGKKMNEDNIWPSTPKWGTSAVLHKFRCDVHIIHLNQTFKLIYNMSVYLKNFRLYRPKQVERNLFNFFKIVIISFFLIFLVIQDGRWQPPSNVMLIFFFPKSYFCSKLAKL